MPATSTTPLGKQEVDNNPVRISLTIAPETAVRLDVLKDATHAPSTVEVVRSAIRVFDYIVEQVIEGNEVCIKKPDGSVTELKIFV